MDFLYLIAPNHKVVGGSSILCAKTWVEGGANETRCFPMPPLLKIRGKHRTRPWRGGAHSLAAFGNDPSVSGPHYAKNNE